MSERQPKLLLEDICASVAKIKTYTAGMSDQQFYADDKTMDAVIRNFEIIGEAANRIPDELKDEYQKINWHKIRGFRNRIVHDYMGIDYEIVWEIICSDLDTLAQDIQEIVNTL